MAHGVATAQTITFTKVADASTPLPGGQGTFAFVGDPSMDGGGNIAFRGSGVPSEQRGIYTDVEGTLDVVANESTPVPGGVGNFFLFAERVSLDEGNVAFGATSCCGHGIYTDAGGTLRVIVDNATPLPGGQGVFSSLGPPSLDGGSVAFQATPNGIYRSTGGTLSVVANTSTPVPNGQGNFFVFSNKVSSDAGKVAFASGSGVYVDDGGALGVVADSSTPVPGGEGLFAFLDAPSLDGESVAFSGVDGLSRDGIYRYDSGVLSVVADSRTPVPGRQGKTFWFLEDPSMDGGNVAFWGMDEDGVEGIYAEFDGVLMKIINTSDMLDGEAVDFVSISEEGLSGDEIAFQAISGHPLTPGVREGVFVATVPEPQSGLVCGLGIAAVAIVAALRRKTRFTDWILHACAPAPAGACRFAPRAPARPQ